MNVHIYQADLYCDDCILDVKHGLGFALEGQPETTFDSDDYPKGPFLASEADYPQHCTCCNVHLESPLTGDGEKYVKDALLCSGNPFVLATWRSFYDYLEHKREN